uniref:Uncharacterized protein n=1 Tax=Rhizophora mucronata TaxID=61149 RepID=A0A2P2R4R0_RHIMU
MIYLHFSVFLFFVFFSPFLLLLDRSLDLVPSPLDSILCAIESFNYINIERMIGRFYSFVE